MGCCWAEIGLKNERKWKNEICCKRLAQVNRNYNLHSLKATFVTHVHYIVHFCSAGGSKMLS